MSKTSLQFVETNLQSILDKVLIDFEVLVNQKQATITSDVLPTIEAIPLQMNQLLFNLVGNALKFSRPNVSPVINITVARLNEETIKNFRQLDSSKKYYEITVTDNGIGFSQEYADKIFTIFQTLNEKSSYGGHGIGLALCRKIVTTHHGIIYAQSNNHQGAAFTFILPATQS